LEHVRHTETPLTRIQKLIASRMLASKRSKPCFYIEAHADVGEILTFRKKLTKKAATRITTNTFFLRALAVSARQFPRMIGLLEDGCVRIAGHVNVGFAVNAPQGVIVPVIKDADRKSLSRIAEQEQRFVQHARSNDLPLADMEGETIALSNLGAYGVDAFAAIIPPPASTIMAVGNVLREVVPVEACPEAAGSTQGGSLSRSEGLDRPALADGKGRHRPVAVRKAVRFTLAVDRRVVDEIYAARFLRAIVERVENPRSLAELDLAEETV